jgi:putative transposase
VTGTVRRRRRRERGRRLLDASAREDLIRSCLFHAFLRPLFRHDWVVYATRPFGGPEHVLHYLARYTHRVAISNHRIVHFADGKVTFRWKDYAHKSKQRLMTVTAEEFLRRFLLHSLPLGLVRIRLCGFLANRRRGELLPVCKRLLEVLSQNSTTPDASDPRSPGAWLCPHCGGAMVLMERLTPHQVLRRSVERECFADTS